MQIIETPGMLTTDQIEAGYSKHFCPECNRHLTEGEYKTFYGCNQYHNKTELLVVPSSHHLLNADNAKDVVWYHSTNIVNWLDVLQSAKASEYFGTEEGDVPFVHVGTRGAAMQRAVELYAGVEDLYFEADETINGAFMYAVRLKEDAVISQHISADTNDWPFYVEEETKDKMGGDALRYVNRWESTGSVSMLIDPQMLELVSVEVLDLPKQDSNALINA